jgi:integrase
MAGDKLSKALPFAPLNNAQELQVAARVEAITGQASRDRLKKNKGLVREAQALIHAGAEQPSGERAAPVRRVQRPKQIEKPVAGVKHLRELIYASGERRWLFHGPKSRTGKPRRKVLGRVDSMSLMTAVTTVDRMLRRAEQGLDPSEATMTLSEFFARVYLALIMCKLRSWKDHQCRFKVHVEPAIGHYRMEDITGVVLNRLVAQLRPAATGNRKLSELSDATVNRVIALLKVVFATAERLGYVQSNPAKSLKLRRERNQGSRMLMPEERAQFFGALKTAPDKVRLLVCLLLLTGMRIGEVLGAKWAWVDEEARLLTLPTTKAGRPRAVPLSPQAMAVVQELKGVRVNEYLFPGRDGVGHMARPGRAYQQLVAEAGTPGLTPHAFRRTFATLALQSGEATVNDVSKLLGHGSVAVTQRYLVVQHERLHVAAASVGALFDGVTQEG